MDRACIPEQTAAAAAQAGPICPDCSAPAAFLPSSESVYRGRNFGPLWICHPCQAWVGCHPGTANPLGRLANAELRAAKIKTHAAFDPLWEKISPGYGLAALPAKSRQRNEYRIQKRGRTRAYRWLADQLGISVDDCHIGHFDTPTCEKATTLCRSTDATKIRAWAKERGL